MSPALLIVWSVPSWALMTWTLNFELWTLSIIYASPSLVATIHRFFQDFLLRYIKQLHLGHAHLTALTAPPNTSWPDQSLGAFYRPVSGAPFAPPPTGGCVVVNGQQERRKEGRCLMSHDYVCVHTSSVQVSQPVYRTRSLLSAYAYISTGRKPAPNSEMRLTTRRALVRAVIIPYINLRA